MNDEERYEGSKKKTREMSDADVERMKKNINQAIWESAPGDVTISEAERAACEALCAIQKVLGVL